MLGSTTIDPVEEGEEIEFHSEGLVLFSPTGSCYGMNLSEIVEKVKPDITNYGESVVIEPHGDGLTRAISGPEDHILLLENSIWLIDCECLIDDQWCNDLKHLIRTFPLAGNSIVWIDEEIHNISNEDKKLVNTMSEKIEIVECESLLMAKIKDYIQYSANPTFGCGSIADWRNEVHRLQRTIG